MVDIINQLEFTDHHSSSIQKTPQNIQAIKLFSTEKAFILEPNTRTTQINTRLIIDRYSKNIKQEPLTTTSPDLNNKPYSLHSAFIGLIPINSITFIVLAEKVLYQQLYPVGPDFFEIQSTSFIPLSNVDLTSLQNGQQIVETIHNIKQLLTQGYYFTYEQTNIDKPKFMWNRFLCKELYQNNISKWDLLVIQGFVGSYSVYLEGKKVTVALIARRAKSGTRQKSTGAIDEIGNVANFVETEQIVSVANIKCSFIQIRGSVPVYWRQKGVLIKNVEIYNTQIENQKILEKHLSSICEQYERILIVNLMNSNKSFEKQLIQLYEQGVQQMNSDQIRYVYYNFDQDTQGFNFHAVNEHVKGLSPMIKNLLFDAEDIVTKQHYLQQRGVIRTNCLACLDRTNVYQQRIALLMLEFQLNQMGITLYQICGQRALDVQEESIPLFVNFRNLWADHGDLISQHYTGTGSIHSTQVRKGQQQSFIQIIGSGLIPLNRFYKTNFSEHIRQESIEIFLGKHKRNEQQLKLQQNLENFLMKNTSAQVYDFNQTLKFLAMNEQDLKKHGLDGMQFINYKKLGDEGEIYMILGWNQRKTYMIKLFGEEDAYVFDEELEHTNQLQKILGNSMPYNIAFNKEKKYLIYDLGTVTLQNFTIQRFKLSLFWTEQELLYIIIALAKILKQLQNAKLYVSDMRPSQILVVYDMKGKYSIKLNNCETLPSKLEQFPSTIVPEYMDPKILNKIQEQANVENETLIHSNHDIIQMDPNVLSVQEAQQAGIWMIARSIYVTLFHPQMTSSNDLNIMIPQLEEMIKAKQYATLCNLLKKMLRIEGNEPILDFDSLIEQIEQIQKLLGKTISIIDEKDQIINQLSPQQSLDFSQLKEQIDLCKHFKQSSQGLQLINIFQKSNQKLQLSEQIQFLCDHVIEMTYLLVLHGKYDEAEKEANKVMTLLSNTNERETPSKIDMQIEIYLHLIKCYQQQNRNEDALYQLSICLSSVPNNHPFVCNLYLIQSYLQKEITDQLESALVGFQQLKGQEQLLVDPNSLKLAFLKQITQLFLKKEDYKTGLQYAIERHEMSKLFSAEERIEALAILAVYQQNFGEYQNAINTYEQAVLMSQQLYKDEYHPRILQLRDQLLALKQKQKGMK